MSMLINDRITLWVVFTYRNRKYMETFVHMMNKFFYITFDFEMDIQMDAYYKVAGVNHGK